MKQKATETVAQYVVDAILKILNNASKNCFLDSFDPVEMEPNVVFWFHQIIRSAHYLTCTTEEEIEIAVSNCPLSSKQFKSNIIYLNYSEKRILQREILNLEIAKYKYNSKASDKSENKKLGFIIEDLKKDSYFKDSNGRRIKYLQI